MSNLIISQNAIRQIDNLYSLNDLHKASGNAEKHRPSLFIRLDTTQDLISEIQKEVKSTDLIFKTTGGRGLRGTYACEELVLSYAMWINPKFHLVVLRAFLAMHRNQPQQLALPEPEKKYTFEFTEYELEQLVWLWCSHSQMNTLLGQLEKPLEAIGSRFSAMVYGHHHEYKRHYIETKDTITRLVKPFQQSERLNWTRAISLIDRAVIK